MRKFLSKKCFSKSREEIVNICKNHNYFNWTPNSAVTNPIVVDKAEGCYVYDKDGKRYFDLIAQLFSVNAGHNHPRIIEAIQKQAAKLAFVSPVHLTDIRAEATEELMKVTPGDLNYFMFTVSGTECNENIIKLVRHVTGRHKIISRYRSYHGTSLTTQTLTGDPRTHQVFPTPSPGFVKTWDPYFYRSKFAEPGMTEEEFAHKMVSVLEEQLMYENPATVAAIYFEPISGTNGAIIPHKAYYQGVKKLCEKHGILFVFDEVLNGFGRTGKWFASEHFDVVPDIMATSKGISNSLVPLAAMCTNKAIFDQMRDRPFPGGSTFGASAIGLAACAESIRVYRDEKLVENSEKMGLVLRKWMDDMTKKHPSIGEGRCKGLLGVLEFVKNKETKEPIGPLAPLPEPMVKLVGEMRQNGVAGVAYANFLHFSPPLCVKEHELKEALDVIDKAISATADKYV